jgi:hypothetical protein
MNDTFTPPHWTVIKLRSDEVSGYFGEYNRDTRTLTLYDLVKSSPWILPMKVEKLQAFLDKKAETNDFPFPYILFGTG